MRIVKHNAQPIPHVIIAGLSFTGMVILYIVTYNGVGLFNDSIVYFTVAGNLNKGIGFYSIVSGGALRPCINFPPLYPLFLSFLGFFKISPFNAARILNCFLWGANIYLLGYLCNNILKMNLWITVFGAIFMLFSIAQLKIFSLACSEPLFNLFLVSGLICISFFISFDKLLWLILGAIAIALALLTRYVGIVLVLSGLLAVFFLSHEKFITKIYHSLIFISISTLPTILWGLKNTYYYGKGQERELLFHPLTISHFIYGFYTLSTLLVPGIPAKYLMVRYIFLGLALLGLLLIIWQLVYNKVSIAPESFEVRNFILTFIIFIFGYLFFVVICIWLFEADLNFDNRILFPIYFPLLILILYVIQKVLNINKPALVKHVMILCLGLLFINVLFGTAWIIYNLGDAEGLNSKAMRHSKLIEKVKYLPKGTTIYTNGRPVIIFFTGRYPNDIPIKGNIHTNKLNDKFASEILMMGDNLRKNKGLLVYFRTTGVRGYAPTEEELKKLLSLEIYANEKDGAIYRVK